MVEGSRSIEHSRSVDIDRGETKDQCDHDRHGHQQDCFGDPPASLRAQPYVHITAVLHNSHARTLLSRAQYGEHKSSARPLTRTTGRFLAVAVRDVEMAIAAYAL